MRGHAGPWRYVETIEVWRKVLEVTDDEFVVEYEWHDDDDIVPDSSYLVCWASVPGGYCSDRVSPAFGTIITRW